ncbi:MAG TPA: caspase family protein [Burkholderiales bacterium]|nr:caspase family protein [Burkholderiales bacterium]
MGSTWSRRRALQGALAGACSALLPATRLLAQSSATTPSLLRARRIALVIGNSKYRQAPLRNPINDARGMAEELKKAGFGVNLGLELSQADMREAIRTFADALAKTGAIGLFYFAGHGAQLAWRNYLLPVDAEIASVEDLRKLGVDVNSLIEGIRKAGNPMNLIILDACRDNPFGSTARVNQKGLSQLDAPPGTLLAYATAPGNTAIDGDGQHGLYTEHLLKEIQVPEAKVEDVFKRVRLGVRRRSNGLQIPWESTSLEEDFWFIPPRELKKLADAEIEREFRQEQALWERAHGAAQPAPLEDYLRRYPNGRFAELAQLQLDRALAKLGEKKIEVIAAPKNPYTKGTAKANTAYRIGDSFSYRLVDTLTRLERSKYVLRVTQITDDEVIFNKGNTVTDLLGNYRKAGGADWSGSQTVPVDFSVGKRWNTRFTNMKTRAGLDTVVDLDLRITDRETVTVPAGTFNAFRIDAKGWRTGSGVNELWDLKTWYAPDSVRRPIAWEWLNRNRSGNFIATNRHELTAFKQK